MRDTSRAIYAVNTVNGKKRWFSRSTWEVIPDAIIDGQRLVKQGWKQISQEASRRPPELSQRPTAPTPVQAPEPTAYDELRQRLIDRDKYLTVAELIKFIEVKGLAISKPHSLTKTQLFDAINEMI